MARPGDAQATTSPSAVTDNLGKLLNAARPNDTGGVALDRPGPVLPAAMVHYAPRRGPFRARLQTDCDRSLGRADTCRPHRCNVLAATSIMLPFYQRSGHPKPP